MPLELTRRFVDQYQKLPAVVQHKVDKALKFLDTDFHHPGLHSHPIEGSRGIFEAYVNIKYRLTFERRKDVIILRNVDNHDECLKNP